MQRRRSVGPAFVCTSDLGSLEASSSSAQNAGKTLMNMLRSHNAAYKALKAMPGAESVAIGIVHNVFWLEPKGKGPLYFHVRRVPQPVIVIDSTVPEPSWRRRTGLRR